MAILALNLGTLDIIVIASVLPILTGGFCIGVALAVIAMGGPDK